MEEKIIVLFADDEVEDLIGDFKDLFPEFEFIPQSTLTPKAVLESLKQYPEITVVILDLYKNGIDKLVGIDILKAIKDNRIQVIVYSQVADRPELVNECDSAGAYDYLAKNEISLEQIKLKIRSAHQRAMEYRNYQDNELEEVPTKYGLDGRSNAIRKVQKLIEKVAPIDINVMITGETGVGKELVARGIHSNSTRKGKNKFFTQNIAAVAHEGNLLQSELFGHVKGAFTGADKDREGLFYQAGKCIESDYGPGNPGKPVRGTVFLDEIGDAPLDVQISLLRVIQERKVKPLGSDIEIPEGEQRLDFRLICATNRNLSAMIKEGDFRPDLYYRIARVLINVPPLRERKEDIAILANEFFANYRKKYEEQFKIPENIIIDTHDMEYMKNYDWPGNVRELEGVIERGLILGDSKDGVFRLWEDDRARMQGKRIQESTIEQEQLPTPKLYWQEIVNNDRKKKSLNDIRDEIGNWFALHVYKEAKSDEQSGKLDKKLEEYFDTKPKTLNTQVRRIRESVE